MKKSGAVFLQAVVLIVGIGVLVFMLWEPHLEGRNVGATLFEIYFKDPFLALAYIGSIAFFVALYQTFKLLGYVGQNNIFSQEARRAVRIIKYCGRILVTFVVAAEVYLFVAVRGSDDIAGGVFMGLLAIVIFGTIAIAAQKLERRLQVPRLI